MELISKISKKHIVCGVPQLNFVKDKICIACQKVKQTKMPFKAKNVVSTSRPLTFLVQ
ncbi:hypothetical protein CDL12_16131 [Handroanthus impetiginosus]|uniref:Uncharacterized protein n=1 Tax=Handroanthus impetiginosus TaxID=429701 RepID=A0A2G9H1V0_9LAMI|nr:hypothetical protein CDL12_16131 [Handroanthus impetiginosus]